MYINWDPTTKSGDLTIKHGCNLESNSIFLMIFQWTNGDLPTAEAQVSWPFKMPPSRR